MKNQRNLVDRVVVFSLYACAGCSMSDPSDPFHLDASKLKFDVAGVHTGFRSVAYKLKYTMSSSELDVDDKYPTDLITDEAELTKSWEVKPDSTVLGPDDGPIDFSDFNYGVDGTEHDLSYDDSVRNFFDWCRKRTYILDYRIGFHTKKVSQCIARTNVATQIFAQSCSRNKTAVLNRVADLEHMVQRADDSVQVLASAVHVLQSEVRRLRDDVSILMDANEDLNARLDVTQAENDELKATLYGP